MRQEVVIVGANFVGPSAALALPADRDVAGVDPQQRFEWLPNIHELASNARRRRHRRPAAAARSAGRPRHRQGGHAAGNVPRHRRESLLPTAPSPKPALMALGDRDAFLIAGSRGIASPALAAKGAVCQPTITGYDAFDNAADLWRASTRAGQAIGELVLATLHFPPRMPSAEIQ